MFQIKIRYSAEGLQQIAFSNDTNRSPSRLPGNPKVEKALGFYVMDRPDVTVPGAAIIFDEALLPGAAEYNYHLSRPPTSIAGVNKMPREPPTARVARWKEAEHEEMLVNSRNRDLRDIFLARAPRSSFASTTSELR